MSTTISHPKRASVTRTRPVDVGRAVAWCAVGVALGALASVYLPRTEAGLVAWACRTFSPRTMSYGSSFLIDLGTVHTRTFAIGTGCSAAVMIMPLLVCATVLLVVRAAPLGRVAAATATSALLIVVVNLGRITGNAWVARTYGEGTAFTVSHVLVGTLVSILLAAVACWAFLRMALPRRDNRSTSGRGVPGGRGGRSYVAKRGRP